MKNKKNPWYLEDNIKYPVLETKQYRYAKLKLKKTKSGFGVFIICEDGGAMQVNCEKTKKIAFDKAKTLIDQEQKFASLILVFK